MQVTVKLFGALRQFLPAGSSFNSCQLTIPSGSMLDDVLALLPIPEHKKYLVIINDEKINAPIFSLTEIIDGDEIVLLPPIKGG